MKPETNLEWRNFFFTPCLSRYNKVTELPLLSHINIDISASLAFLKVKTPMDAE